MHPSLTLSVNPALDISTSTGKVTSGHKLRCSSSRLDPGGSGVNVARVVQRLGGRTLAVFTVDGTTTGKQFRFVLQGPELSEPEWRLCLAVVADSIPVGGYVVASGSLPPGVPEDFYARVARLAQGHTLKTAFRADAAEGSPTVATPATELCGRADVERLDAKLSAQPSPV